MIDALSSIPPRVAARAQPFGRLPFAFGQRAFVALLLGIAWLAPAWWSPRFVAAMLLWDALVLAAWAWDLLRLPAPQQLEVERAWRARPALGVSAAVTIRIT